MASKRVQKILARYRALTAEKNPWLDHYQLIGEFIMTRKQQFTNTLEVGGFLNRDLFDSTAIRAANVMASAMLGALWPNGAKTFRLARPDNISDSSENKKFYEKSTKTMTKYMDKVEAGLGIALMSYMLDQAGFGTSGIAVLEQEDPETPIVYQPWDVKTMLIDEGKNGMVDTVYNVRKMTIRKAVQEYGMDVLSKSTREKVETNKLEDTIEILHVIEPRDFVNAKRLGNKGLPFASIHIEIGAEKLLKESGFEELTVFVARFAKAIGEKYGRSPGMSALPDIIELNTVKEAVTVAIEKMLDPPLGVLDDGQLGGGTIDTSAGALNVLKPIAGRITEKNPIFPLYTVGELRGVQELILSLENAITSAFFIDRLLDLNNETRMTLGEAQIRNSLRGESLGMLFARQIAELFSPLVKRTFNILLKRGYLGVVPGSEEEMIQLAMGVQPDVVPLEILEAMMAGKDVYNIQYISPAQRIMQAEEVKGILTTFDFALQNASISPEVIDNIDQDKAIKFLAELSGAPSELLRSAEEVEGLRAVRAERQKELSDLEDARQTSEIARNAAQAQMTGQGGNS